MLVRLLSFLFSLSSASSFSPFVTILFFFFFSWRGRHSSLVLCLFLLSTPILIHPSSSLSSSPYHLRLPPLLPCHLRFIPSSFSSLRSSSSSCSLSRHISFSSPLLFIPSISFKTSSSRFSFSPSSFFSQSSCLKAPRKTAHLSHIRNCSFLSSFFTTPYLSSPLPLFFSDSSHSSLSPSPPPVPLSPSSLHSRPCLPISPPLLLLHLSSPRVSPHPSLFSPFSLSSSLFSSRSSTSNPQLVPRKKRGSDQRSSYSSSPHPDLSLSSTDLVRAYGRVVSALPGGAFLVELLSSPPSPLSSDASQGSSSLSSFSSEEGETKSSSSSFLCVRTPPGLIGKEMICTLGGKLRFNRIRVQLYDYVDVEFNAIDTSRGRIVYRRKKPL